MIKAVIFDMDGLMIDSSSTYVDAETKLLKEYNKEYSHEIRKKYLGKRINGVVEVMIQEYGLPISTTEGENKLRKYLVENYSKPSLILLPGCKKLVKNLSKLGEYLLAVASSSPKEVIEAVIRKFGFENDFDVIVSGEEVTNGKPAPDIFLKCSDLLHILPNECLVLEDAPLGIESAKRAGMKTIAVYNKDNNKPEDFLDLSDKIFSSLEDVNIEVIKEIK